jgi:hypothetical protein
MRLALLPLAAALLAGPADVTRQPAPAPVGAPTRDPATGADVLTLMHDRYAATWYRSLTFTQKTTIHLPDGGTRAETWYESLAQTPTGVRLRIDRGDPAAGDGMLYTVDSAYVFRGGALSAARAGGNEFLPVIEGVYVQPVAQTTREIAAMRVDLARVRAAEWASRPVWVVGAAAGDTTSPQLWVDRERLVAVRMILAGEGGRPGLDVVLGGYVPVGPAGGAWLATKVDIRAGGRLVQTEEYTDWRGDAALDPALFAPGTWTTARHWVKR